MDYNIEIQDENGDKYYPITKAENVVSNNGTSINTSLDTHANNSTIHITTAERSKWNAKASTATATTTTDGLMSANDKKALDGIGATITNTITSSNILTKLKEVDGSNSGLDADLLDGNEASAFAHVTHGNHVPELDTVVSNKKFLRSDNKWIALTAAYIGALPSSGGTVSNSLTVSGALTANNNVTIASGKTFKVGTQTIIDSSGNMAIGASKTFKVGNTIIINSSGVVARAMYNDLAELMEKHDINEYIEGGDVISYSSNGITKSNKYQDRCAVGVCSDTYGFVLGGEEGIESSECIKSGKYAPVGLSGRVYVKVTGDIEIGDLIISSDIDGVGCKCKNYVQGTVIGKALENHKGNSISKIKMLICNI